MFYAAQAFLQKVQSGEFLIPIPKSFSLVKNFLLMVLKLIYLKYVTSVIDYEASENIMPV